MSIWIYRDHASRPSASEVQAFMCLFCRTDMKDLESDYDKNYSYHLRVCPICGWWCSHLSTKSQGSGGEYFSLFGTCAQLKTFDATDMSIPINEIRQFLAAKYEQRNSVHHRKFEETVADVFGSLGFDASTTSYQADGGIDVVLRGGGDLTIGVQVKRSKNKIKVEQIRSFAGALMLGENTKGIFVTTSSYSAGAIKAAAKFSTRGLPIELIDAPRFYDALRLSQRERYKDASDLLSEVGEIKGQTIYDDEGPTYMFMT